MISKNILLLILYITLFNLFSHIWAQESISVKPQFLPVEAYFCVSNSKCIFLEVAEKPEEQELGLMHRSHMKKSRGMLFPFPLDKQALFWMYKTILPLDILFLLDNIIVHIEKNPPKCIELPCPIYGINTPVDEVIELNAGEVDRLGIKQGDKLNVEYFAK